MAGLNLPRFPGNLPWYMFDLANYQLITSAAIPEGEIKDRKDVVIVETPVPGRNFQPVAQGGNGNRKVSFRIPVVQRNNSVGNVLLLKQFDLLRNQSQGFLGLSRLKGQFAPNPKVLYSWGVGSVPLPYFVTRCEFSHRADMVNALGNPTATYVEVELLLDETSPLYKAEEAFRNASSLLGSALGLFGAVSAQAGGGNPF